MACGVDCCGAETLEPEEDDLWEARCEDVLSPEESCEPDELDEPDEDVPDVVVVPPEDVWVAAPMPIDAPRAPTIPRPARPAWSPLLRWGGVMSSTVHAEPVPTL